MTFSSFFCSRFAHAGLFVSQLTGSCWHDAQSFSHISLFTASRICYWMLRSIPGRIGEAGVSLHSSRGTHVQALCFYVVLVCAVNRTCFFIVYHGCSGDCTTRTEPLCWCSLSAGTLHHLLHRSLTLFVESFVFCVWVLVEMLGISLLYHSSVKPDFLHMLFS